MDNSTLLLHRALLRLFKGATKSYANWIDEQSARLALDGLKKEKASLPSERREEIAKNT